MFGRRGSLSRLGTGERRHFLDDGALWAFCLLTDRRNGHFKHATACVAREFRVAVRRCGIRARWNRRHTFPLL